MKLFLLSTLYTYRNGLEVNFYEIGIFFFSKDRDQKLEPFLYFLNYFR